VTSSSVAVSWKLQLGLWRNIFQDMQCYVGLHSVAAFSLSKLSRQHCTMMPGWSIIMRAFKAAMLGLNSADMHRELQTASAGLLGLLDWLTSQAGHSVSASQAR